MELGVLCIEDDEANLAVCYAEGGSVVFDTADFGELYNLQPGSISSLAQCEGGLMSIVYVNGQKGFISADGTVLNRASELASFFEDALPFSNGLAGGQEQRRLGLYKHHRRIRHRPGFRGGEQLRRKSGRR